MAKESKRVKDTEPLWNRETSPPIAWPPLDDPWWQTVKAQRLLAMLGGEWIPLADGHGPRIRTVVTPRQDAGREKPGEIVNDQIVKDEDLRRRVYSVPEVARMFGVHRATVYAIAKKTGSYAGVPAIQASPTRMVFSVVLIDRVLNGDTGYDVERDGESS